VLFLLQSDESTVERGKEEDDNDDDDDDDDDDDNDYKLIGL